MVRHVGDEAWRYQSGVEGVDGKAARSCAANASLTRDVRVVADLVWSSGVVETRSLNKDLDVDLLQILRHTKETSGKVLGSLDHAILGLRSEDRKSLLSSEVIQQFPVQLSVFDTKEEVLAASERS